MKKFLLTSITAVFAVGFLFTAGYVLAAPARTTVQTLKTAVKTAPLKTQPTVVRMPVKQPLPISRPKPLPRPPQLPAYERLNITAPKPDESVNNSFTVSGSAWGWFEGTIPTKVYDYNNVLLYDGVLSIAPVSYSAPTYFSKTITLSRPPTTDAGTIEFNDYSARNGKLVYQKIVPVRFASFANNPVITVLSPNGGETYEAGKTMVINWKVTGKIPSNWDKNSRGIPRVALDLYRNGQYLQFLGFLEDAPFSFKLWPFDKYAPDNYTPGGGYKIKLAAVGVGDITGKYFDFSDGTFSIVNRPAPVPVNQPPVINEVGGPTSLKVNEVGTWTVKASDPDGNYLYYIVDWGDNSIKPSGPTGASQYSSSGQATLTHSYSASGIYKITFTVRDDKGAQAQSSLTVSVGTAPIPSRSFLTVSLDPNTPPAGQVRAGQTNVIFTKVKFSLSGDSRGLNGVQIGSDSSGAGGALANIKIYDSRSGRQLGAAIPKLNWNSHYYYGWVSLSPSLTLTDNETVTLDIVASANATLASDSEFNGTIRLGVWGVNFDFPGAETELPVQGNSMTITLPPLPNPASFSLGFSGSLADNQGRAPAASNPSGIVYGKGWVGQAAKFGSGKGYAQYSCSAASFNQFQGTVEALVKFDQFTRRDAVIWQTNDSRYALYYDYASDNSEKRITARAGGEDSAAQFRFDQNYGSQRNTLTAGDWHYIAMVWSRTPNGPLKQGTVKLYIDGELKDAAQYQDAQNCSSFRVGNNYWPGLNWGDGWLDEVSVRPTALSAEDIKRIYDGYNLPQPVPAPSGLNVSLASSTPAAMTVLSDADAFTYPQSQIPFLKVKFTAPVDMGIQVNTLKFTRRGISTDSDIGALYLVDENNRRLADYTLFSNGAATFSNPDGLFAIPMGTSKIITLKGDLARSSTSVSSGKTIGFDLAQVADVAAGKASVAGSFPLVGNLMSTAAVADLGHVYLTSWTTYPPFVPAGSINQELWRFTAIASSQDMEIRSIKLTAVGLISPLDLRNLRLEADGLQVGQTVSSLAPDKTATFELSRDLASRINRGQEKRFVLKGDIGNFAAGGVFKFTIQKQGDIIAYDWVYGVYNPVTIVNDTTAWALVQPTLGGGTTVVDFPLMTVSKNNAFANRSSYLPTGVINSSQAKIASFVLIAGSGEAVNVTKIVLRDASAAVQLGDNFQNLKLVNGDTQVGDTIGSLDTSGTVATYAFMPSPAIRIASGAQYVVDVYADIKSSPQDVGVVLSPVVFVDAITATGVASNLDLIASNVALQNAYISANGNLTVTTASDTPISQQLLMGATNQEVAKFKLSASVDEDIVVSAIYVAAGLSRGATSTFSNIKLFNGATQIGSAANFSTLSSGNYAIAPFTGLSLTVPRNSNVILTVKTDVSTAANATAGATATFALLPDYDGSTTGSQESIAARGVSSGTTITGDSLDFGTLGSNNDAPVSGNQMTVVVGLQ